MPNFAAASTLVVVATKWRAMSLPPWARNQSRAACALAIVSWVVKVLQATMNSVSRGVSWRSTRRDVVAVDVADEVQRQAAVGEGVERQHRHLRPEVAAADADVDDMADATGGDVAHPLGVGQHGVEHAMHLVAEQALRRAARAARCAAPRGLRWC